jgi:hypothetical protein
MRMTPGFRSLMVFFLSTLATVPTLGFCATSAVAQTGCITGLVTDETGHPLGHVKVEAVKMGGSSTHHQAWTEANGRFQIPGLPPVKYEIVSGDSGGPYPNHANSFFYGIPELYLSITASDKCEDVVIHVGPKVAKLNLSVLDAITKRPIEQPRIELWRASGGGLFTGTTGGKLSVPSQTELSLRVQAVGYDESLSIKLPGFRPEEVRDLSVELQPAMRGCIAGSVIGEDNLPLTDAQIIPHLSTRSSLNDDHPVVTDSHGRFQMNNLEVGPYYIYAQKISAGYLGTDGVVFLTLPSNPPCSEVVLKIGLKAARLRVKAIDAKTAKEILQIHTDYGNEERRSTYSSFVERLTGNVALVEPFRKLSVQITADGYEENGKSVYFGPLAPDEEKTITVELQPSLGPSVPHP